MDKFKKYFDDALKVVSSMQFKPEPNDIMQLYMKNIFLESRLHALTFFIYNSPLMESEEYSEKVNEFFRKKLAAFLTDRFE